MENLVDEIVPHFDRVIHNPKYHNRTKQRFCNDLISVLKSRLEDLAIEAEQTELLDFPDEMH